MKKSLSLLISLILCISVCAYPLYMSASADTIVSINDDNLKQCIVSELKLSSASQLTKTNMGKLTKLDISDRGVRSLSGLEYAVNLKSLDASGCSITDISCLSGLAQLVSLDISHNPVSSAEGLSSCSSLTSLDISYTNINSTSFLKDLDGLRALGMAGTPFKNPSASNMPSGLLILDISDTDISSLNVASQMKKLAKLNASNTKVTNINSAALPNSLKSLDLSGCRLDNPNYGNLKGVQALYLADTGISTLSGIEELKSLTVLDISKNNISSLSPLSGLDNITALDISGNKGVSLTYLAGFDKLRSLWANGIGLTDASAISELTNLRLLDISNNNIGSLSFAQPLAKLSSLAADNAGISDITAASSLDKLAYLSLCGNDISDVSALSGLYSQSKPQDEQLVTLKLSGNKIDDISPLTSLKELRFLDISANSVEFIGNDEQIKALKEISDNGTQVKTVDPEVVNALISEIAGLPSEKDVTASHYDKCVELLGRYNALSGYEQGKVVNLDKLKACYDKVILIRTGISSEKYDIDFTDNIITGITPGTTVQQFLSGISSDNKIEIISGSDKKDVIGTGDTLVCTLGDGSLLKFDICIYGDITGDGIINITDLVAIRRHILGDAVLEGVKLRSANITPRVSQSSDTDVNIADMSALRNYLLGNCRISQK